MFKYLIFLSLELSRRVRLDAAADNSQLHPHALLLKDLLLALSRMLIRT
jgi:hypothetical protein